MKETVNEIVLAENEVMPEIYFRQPGCTFSACGSFTKNIEKIQKFKETAYSQNIYQKQLDKAYIQHDTTYKDFEDLA